jgi:hypothetical protein
MVCTLEARPFTDLASINDKHAEINIQLRRQSVAQLGSIVPVISFSDTLV